MTWIQENGPSAWTNAGTTQADSIFGTPYILTVDSHVYAVRYFRSSPTAGSGHRPSELAIWDNATHAKVWSTTSVPDNGAQAWQTYLIDPPLALAPGDYQVTGYWPSTSGFPQIAASSVTPPSPPLQYGTLLRRYHSTNGNVWPETGDSAQVMGIDAYIVPDSGTGAAPLSADDVRNLLADWLDTSDGTQAHSGPLQDHTTLTTVASQVDDTHNKATGATGFDAIKAVADAVAAAVGGLPGTIAGAVTTITGQLTTMTGNVAQSGLATIGSISHDLASVFNHSLDVLAGHAVTGTSTPNWTWTAGTPIAFVGTIAVTEQADAYLLQVTTLPRGLAITLADGVHVVFRAGWWCECLDGVGSERHYIDFEETWLRDGTRRLGGCLVSLGPEGAGTITPYLLEPV